MKRLEGKRIAITGPRRSAELSNLVENWGGIPVIRPAQGTVFLEDDVLKRQLEKLIREPFDWLLLTTGIGTETIVRAAANLGLERELLEKMRRLKIAARGHKTVNALRKLGLVPDVRDDDGTTESLARAMEPYDLKGVRVAVQFYGEPAPDLIRWLEERGAVCEELLPYRHVPPETGVMDRLLNEIEAGEVDAVCFTTATQVRNLWERAKATGRTESVRRAFAGPVLAAAVGKVTGEALREAGVERVVQPEDERMGNMMAAVADYFERMEAGGAS